MILCPKCKQPIFISDGMNYVLCCNEVIYILNKNNNK